VAAYGNGWLANQGISPGWVDMAGEVKGDQVQSLTLPVGWAEA